MIQLKEAKKEIIFLRKQNVEFRDNNQTLSIRAAVGFQNLTPRPDIKTMIKGKIKSSHVSQKKIDK